MIAYIDSSVILRQVLGQPNRLAQWKDVQVGIASELVEVECLRTLDRYQISGALSVSQSVKRREAVFRLMEELHVIGVSSAVLRRASQPMTTPLGTLDAIHLASAELWRDLRGEELMMATHDQALALAARGNGFRVVGV